MSGWSVAWLLWLAMFAAIEIPALVNKAGGDTLSDHVRQWFATQSKPTGWRWRRYILAAFMTWLSLHFMNVGGF
jgi:hypothetical protein